MFGLAGVRRKACRVEVEGVGESEAGQAGTCWCGCNHPQRHVLTPRCLHQQWAAGGKYRSVGPLQEGNLRKILSSAGQDDELHKIWVCGKPDFTQDLFVKLPAMGVPIHKIHLL